MNLEEMILPNKNFQSSINIDFDFGDAPKIEGLIPTDSVCRYLEELLRDVMAPSNQRAKLFVGAYGKGKSHIALAAVTAMWCKEPASFGRIIEGYEKRGLEFGSSLAKFVEEGRRLLPVIISGSTSDLRHSLLYSLRNALRSAGFEDLMPQTNYDGAIQVLNRWKEEYPQTLESFELISGMSAGTAISKLKNLDTAAYSTFVQAYPELTSGSTFDELEGADVISVYENVLAALQEQGISGIYVVYDEFSKFLEANIDRVSIEDIKLLQDFAELCNRSSQDRQLHLLLISHKSLSNYIDARLPKEKVDGWRGVSGRFREIDMVDDANQYYELMENAIVKDEGSWSKWLEINDGQNERMLERLAERYEKQGLFDEGRSTSIVHGCYPLHPLSAYLLPRMSEKIAQNERTLFTFLCSSEEHSLMDSLHDSAKFVSPNCIYDYFEPLLRNEYYTSPEHKVYELAHTSLRQVEEGSLAARIIKTIAVIDVVAQYDKVAPTKDVIIDIYTDCGFDGFEVEEALNSLIDSQSVVYLRRSNAYLKLKEPSGEPIERRIADKKAQLSNTTSCVDILNSLVRSRALYPSRYNEERRIVRYFDCGFVDSSVMDRHVNEHFRIEGEGDGQVIAVYVDSADAFDELERFARETLSAAPMTIVAFPKKYVDISDSLFSLEAAKQLKSAAGSDQALAEEYEMVVEDYSEIVEEFIEGYFQPELGRSLYFVGGVQERGITRKRKLSEELSLLCDDTYCLTPVITNESLNKNVLTGTAYKSRTRILKALCARNLEVNLGFVGNGQETSMARSALAKTGLLKNFDTTGIVLEDDDGNLEPGMIEVRHVIRSFIENADDDAFSSLYEQLTGPKEHIGLRRGPIPLFLACELRNYRDEIEIMYKGEERELSEELLNDIDSNPGDYQISRVDWTPEMGEYLVGLAEVFGCGKDAQGRNAVANTIKVWYAGLPQFVRNSRIDHTVAGKSVSITKTRSSFFNAIRRFNTNPNILLFEELPHVFDQDGVSMELVESIRREKEACDSYLDRTISALATDLKNDFDPEAPEEASLGAVLHDWVDGHQILETHSFSGISNQVINAIKAANGDDSVTVNRLAKAATSLRIEDWNDARFDDFLAIVRSTKNEVESYGATSAVEEEGDTLGILVRGSDGRLEQKTFDRVECSGRSRLLKSSLKSCLNDMGGSLSPEEKRQIVFEVLEELC